VCVPGISKRVLSRLNVGGLDHCPGEWDCERFESSAEPKSDACVTCPKLATKPITISPVTSADERAAAAIVEHVSDLRDELRAGFLDAQSLTPLESELLKIWLRTESDLAAFQSSQRGLF
jgi:hypothetical protein